MRRSVSLLLACVVLAPRAGAQQVDMQAMQRWGNAKVVYYSVEGAYSGPTSMTRVMGGMADVADHVSMTLEWSLGEAKLLKVTNLRNTPSRVSNLRDREPSCLPPVLNGSYEHATVLDVSTGFGGAIDLKVDRSYPAVGVAQSCTASRKSIPAEKKTSVETLVVPSPMMLAMGVPSSPQLSFSADKKSMIVRKGDWTWTFTPSTTPPAK